MITRALTSPIEEDGGNMMLGSSPQNESSGDVPHRLHVRDGTVACNVAPGLDVLVRGVAEHTAELIADLEFQQRRHRACLERNLGRNRCQLRGCEFTGYGTAPYIVGIEHDGHHVANDRRQRPATRQLVR